MSYVPNPGFDFYGHAIYIRFLAVSQSLEAQDGNTIRSHCITQPVFPSSSSSLLQVNLLRYFVLFVTLTKQLSNVHHLDLNLQSRMDVVELARHC